MIYIHINLSVISIWGKDFWRKSTLRIKKIFSTLLDPDLSKLLGHFVTIFLNMRLVMDDGNLIGVQISCDKETRN